MFLICGLVNVSGFRIIDVESLITGVGVGMIDKVAVEKKDVIHQTHLENLDIFLLFFAFYKFLPSFQ